MRNSSPVSEIRPTRSRPPTDSLRCPIASVSLARIQIRRPHRISRIGNHTPKGELIAFPDHEKGRAQWAIITPEAKDMLPDNPIQALWFQSVRHCLLESEAVSLQPDEDSNSPRWGRLSHTESSSTLSLIQEEILTSLPKPRGRPRKNTERREYRFPYFRPAPWPSVEMITGVPQRTWEGWEQNRPIPFHRLCALLAQLNTLKNWP